MLLPFYRSLLSDVSTTELRLSDKGTDVKLLVEGIYHTSLQLTWDNLEPLLELARKYDVDDIWRSCTLALRTLLLNTDVLPRVLRMAATYGLDDLEAKCQQAIAAGSMFEQLERCA